jgi:sugar lactone lactonase YvrE
MPPPMHARPPDHVLRARNTLGECILWDSRGGQLWWTDIQERRLHRYDWSGGGIEVLDCPERVGSFGFVAGGGRLITAFASGIGLFDLSRRSVAWLDRPAPPRPGVRFNDGRVDRRGRFWAGTMVEGDEPGTDGCLYSISGKDVARRHLEGLRISNGLCFSPDGNRVYHADSPTRIISVFDLGEPEGSLTGRREFTRIPEGAVPDGAAIDADGCLWVALWGGGCIVRYTPAGVLDRTLAVPARQPTCVCFGGPDLDTLCVTSARQGLTDDVLRDEPDAGDVFLYRVGVRGLPEPEFCP